MLRAEQEPTQPWGAYAAQLGGCGRVRGGSPTAAPPPGLSCSAAPHAFPLPKTDRERNTKRPSGVPLALLCAAPTSSCSSGFCSSGASSSTAGGMLLLMLNVTVILRRRRES